MKAAWTQAITRLAADSPAALALLRIAAHLAPEDIPFRLLLHPAARLPEDRPGQDITAQVRALCDSDLAVDDAVTALRRHNLIDPVDETFTVHELVQAVTRDHMNREDDQAWHAMAAALVEHAVPASTLDRKSWPTCLALLPHAQIVADPLGMPMWRLARFLEYSGDYDAACAQWQTLADAHTTRLGPEHPDTLIARAHHARLIGLVGDAVEARDLYAALLPIRTKVSGAEHPEALAVRANLAYWTGEAGDAAAARDLFAVLLPVRARVRGPEHPDTLLAWANLAYWTGAAGDAVAARDSFAALLPVREKVVGAEHPETDAVRTNLAYWTRRAGTPS